MDKKVWLIDATVYKKDLVDELRVQKNKYFRIKSLVKNNHTLFKKHIEPKEKTFSMGLLQIGSILSVKGFDVLFLSLKEAKDRISSDMDAHLPGYVGFSAVTPTIPKCVEVSKLLKSINSNIIISLGGYHAKCAKQITDKTYPGVFDNIIDSEYSKAAGIVVGIEIEKNEYPLDYSLLPFSLDEYSVNLFTSVGCKYNCFYCQDNRKKYRELSLDGGLNSIKRLIKQGTLIHFCDSAIGGNPQRALQVCSKLQSINHKMLLSCDIREDFIDVNLLEALQKAGFSEIRIGVDSADENVLNQNNRNMKIDSIKKKLNLIKDNSNIYVSIYLLTGLPGSSKKSLKKNLSFIEELFEKELINEVKHHLYVPYPTDDVSKRHSDVTIIDENWENYDRQSFPVYKLKNLTQTEIYNQFLITEKKINDLWIKYNGININELPLVSYPEYNKQCYLERKNQSCNILHLSDLHFKSNGTEDADKKDDIEFLKLSKIREKLYSYITALPKKPDFVIISGDFTQTKPDKKQYNLSISLFNDLIEKNFLPGKNRIIVTPGNHDVVREKDDQDSRFQPFRETIGNEYIKPWFPEIDASKNDILKILKRQANAKLRIIGGKQADITHCLPFILDRKKRVLIYTFNSAYVSNSKIVLNDNTLKHLKKLKEDIGKNNFKEIDTLMHTDPGHVHCDELNLFSEITQELQKTFENEYDDYLKIAVLHHHISSIPVLPEVKKFETLINAGEFKHNLKESGFNMVVHGHKHWPETFLDSSISGGGAQLVISGGTIEDTIAAKRNKKEGFHWINFSVLNKYIDVRYIELKKNAPDNCDITDTKVETFAIPSSKLKKGLVYKTYDFSKIIEQTNRNMINEINDSCNKIGWEHYLGAKDKFVDPVATAFGLRIMKLINSYDINFLSRKSEIIDSLYNFKSKQGGWYNSDSVTEISRPEITAWILDAFYCWGEKEYIDETIDNLIDSIDKTIDQVFFERTFCVAHVLRILCQFAEYPHAKQKEVISNIIHLSDILYKSIVKHSKNSNQSYWTNNTLHFQNYRSESSSVANTAHSILALNRAFKAVNGWTSHDNRSLFPAINWLINQEDNWGIQSEEIIRIIDNKREALTIYHYARPWAIVALLESGIDPRDKNIINAIKKVLEDEHTDDKGLWWVDMTNSKPIWATHDALFALQIFSQKFNVVDFTI